MVKLPHWLTKLLQLEPLQQFCSVTCIAKLITLKKLNSSNWLLFCAFRRYFFQTKWQRVFGPSAVPRRAPLCRDTPTGKVLKQDPREKLCSEMRESMLPLFGKKTAAVSTSAVNILFLLPDSVYGVKSITAMPFWTGAFSLVRVHVFRTKNLCYVRFCMTFQHVTQRPIKSRTGLCAQAFGWPVQWWAKYNIFCR